MRNARGCRDDSLAGCTGRSPLSMLEELNTHLALDLDDHCLRLLLGEEGDESKPASSSGNSVSTCGGSGPAAAAGKDAPAESALAAEQEAAADEEDVLLLEAAPSMR